jgi:hypothetical protein
MKRNALAALLLLLLGAALAEWLSTRDAHAQAFPPASSGGGSDACTGQACEVTSLTSSGAIQGTTLALSGALTSSVGSGNNWAVTGDGVRWADASAPTSNYVRFSEGTTFYVNNSFTIGNGHLTMTGVGKFADFYASVALRDSSTGPLDIDDAQGVTLVPQTLTTCGTVPEGTIHTVPGSAGNKTKVCICTYDGTTYAWVNAVCLSSCTGNTTTCPATP